MKDYEQVWTNVNFKETSQKSPCFNLFLLGFAICLFEQ